MSETDELWQEIDRAVGYLQGFMPALWAMLTCCTREVVSDESVVELERVVGDIATATARMRELTEVDE